MSRKKKDIIEFRYYELPPKECALALLGDKWIRRYGEGIGHQHFHNLLEIGLCREGHGILVLDGKRQLYGTGDLTIIPANVPHTTYSDDICFWEYLFLDPVAMIRQLYPENTVLAHEMIDSVNRQTQLLKAGTNPEMVQHVTEIMEEFRTKRPYYREISKRMCQALVYRLIRISKVAQEEREESLFDSTLGQIKPALEYVDRNFAETIKASTLAEQCSMSETHFRRVFEGYINMTPMDYVNLVRIQKACELMRRTDYSMDQVAAECGFATTSTFNRNFKKYLKTSPYQWKKSKDNFEAKVYDAKIMPLPGW